MPATVIGLVAQFLIHPFLNQIVEMYENKRNKDLQILSIKLVFTIFIFGIICSILAYFLGTQVLGFIYGIDLSMYKIGLVLIIIAATLYTIGVIYSSILTSIRETFSQFIIYIIVSIFAFITSNLFTKIGNIDGAIHAYLLIMTLQFLMYIVYTNIRILKTVEEMSQCQK
jgi:O-antigen/teichoic acid export membrane protein